MPEVVPESANLIRKGNQAGVDVRFSGAQVEEWRSSGFILIDDIFQKDEIAQVVEDY